MKLKEFEGKKLFRDSGIPVPKGVLVRHVEEVSDPEGEVVVKVQTLQGGRGKKGGIAFCKDKNDLKDAMTGLLGHDFNGETVGELLVEEKLDVANEYYAGFLFDTKVRKPVLILSTEGGVDIEEVKKNTPGKVLIKGIDVLEGLPAWRAREYCEEAGFTGKKIVKVAGIVCKLYKCFKENDMKMVEVNPLVEDSEGKFIAADAVVILDDDALKRHDFGFPERQGFKEKTDRELRANAIDKEDYKGVSGRTFIDIGGEVAVMSSGGGASVTAMDALLTYGATLSNYTEYSGNPPAEKVEKLARIVLEPKNVKALFIVGGRANFTRIDITMKAILDVILDIGFDKPIVVRRAGPNDKEAFEMYEKAAKEHGLSIELYDDSTPISVAAKRVCELVYGGTNGNSD